jgi:putative ABC transport system permease protein
MHSYLHNSLGSSSVRSLGFFLLLALLGCSSPDIRNFTLTHGATTETVRGEYIKPTVFEALETKPFLGRLFTSAEYNSTAPVVILLHNSWKQRFQSSPTAIGQTLRLNGRDHTIIAVLPPTYDAPSTLEFFLPTN